MFEGGYYNYKPTRTATAYKLILWPRSHKFDGVNIRNALTYLDTEDLQQQRTWTSFLPSRDVANGRDMYTIQKLFMEQREILAGSRSYWSIIRAWRCQGKETTGWESGAAA